MKIRNLLKFFRIKIAFYISMVSAFGYLLFNPLNSNLLIVSAAAFFAGIAGYSHNNFFDYEEDKVNKRDLIINKTFLIGPMLSFFLGLFLIINFNLHSILLYSLPVILSWIYSSLRLKRFFLLKNVYTSFGITLIFLFGASLFNLGWFLLPSSFFIFTTFLAASICSDLRDYKGDKEAGIKTIPVAIGFKKTKWVIIVLLLASFYLSFKIFPPASLFILLVITLVFFNKPEKAHLVSGLMFFILNVLIFYNKLL